jgi:trans-aconitate methyltransferase
MLADSLHAHDWEEMAAVDPLWAILSNPAKRFGKWEIEDFLRTGREEVAGLMQTAGQFALPQRHRRAIDFGCGVGRLTRALRDYFPECYGIDVSQAMLQRARQLAPGCEFRQGSDLGSFPRQSADLIYSSLVLQHQPDKKRVKAIISDMIRVLAPGGLLVFQMPLHLPLRNRLQLRRRAYRLVRALGLTHNFAYSRLKLTPIRMLSLSQTEVEQIVHTEDGVVVSTALSSKYGKAFESGIYYCTVKC